MRSSAAERVRPTPWDALVAVLVVACAGLIFWIFRPSAGNILTATVVLDGETVAQFRLDQLTEPVTFDVPGAEWPITLEAEQGRIRVLHSDCPSQDCVHTGWVDRDRGQIVCLPNRMVVSVSGTQAADVDAVTG